MAPISSCDTNVLPRGRPRVLTQDAILDCALELGLDDLTMRKLANRLGVGAGTVYQYFDTREELLRAASMRAMSKLDFPDERGQSWVEFVREYTLSIFTILTENPSFILTYDITQYGFSAHFDVSERFLRPLVDRGFTPQIAMSLLTKVSAVAHGAAVEAVRQRSSGVSPDEAHRLARNELDGGKAETFPLFNTTQEQFFASPAQKIEEHLDLLFQAFEAKIQSTKGKIEYG